MHQLRDYQQLCVGDALAFFDEVAKADEEGRVMAGVERRRAYAAPTGCHARGERVLLCDGTPINVEDVTVGMQLLGEDGPRRVLELHRGRQVMARVTPVKGAPFVVNLDHMLTLVRVNDNKSPGKAGQRVDVSVREWLSWAPYRKHVHKLERVPGVWGVQSSSALPVAPWLLGLLLGDGSLTHGALLTNSDPAIHQHLHAVAEAHAVELRVRHRGGDRADDAVCSFVRPRGRKTNFLWEQLQLLGLAGARSESKFVPTIYLQADREARLNLLAGMIDTDGHQLDSGGYDWISKSPRMAEQFTFLCRSVGLAAYLTVCEKSCQTGATGTYYRVSVSGDCDMIPCRVPRKQARPRRQKKDVLRTGFTVELLPEDNYYGFEVDGDHRYLMADFTLTHNSGKTLTATAILLALRAGGADAWVVTPSLEIARGFLRAQGVADADMPTGDEALFDLAEKHHVSTPTRMRNRVADGRKEVPDVWIVDELHHAIEGNEVSGCNFTMGPASVWIGFTATPYRGTPAGTQALREAWGEPYLLATFPEAVAQGACVVPNVEVVPLLDDDLVQVRGGEFVDKSASKEVVSRVEALASLVAGYATTRVDGGVNSSGSSVGMSRLFDLPTLVAVPSTECVGALVEALDRLGVDAIPVTQSTTGEARLRAFEECRQRRAVIVQIKVVSEGVDLPWLGRLVDARPMVSPVAWLQQLGRLTRPGHGVKHYVCTNRNLERHAYLLQGAIPRSAVGAAQAAFKGPSKRGPGRIVGLEALGRLKPIELPLANGVKSTMFSVSRIMNKVVKPVTTEADDGSEVTKTEVGARREQFAILHDPCTDEPLVARREDVLVPGEEPQWGKWERCTLPTDFDGFATSHRRGAASDKQLEVWRKHARRLGLDRDAEGLQGRHLDALFMLLQLGASLAGEVA